MLNKSEEISNLQFSQIGENQICSSKHLKNQDISYIVAKLIILLFDNIINDQQTVNLN